VKAPRKRTSAAEALEFTHQGARKRRKHDRTSNCFPPRSTKGIHAADGSVKDVLSDGEGQG